MFMYWCFTKQLSNGVYSEKPFWNTNARYLGTYLYLCKTFFTHCKILQCVIAISPLNEQMHKWNGQQRTVVVNECTQFGKIKKDFGTWGVPKLQKKTLFDISLQYKLYKPIKNTLFYGFS